MVKRRITLVFGEISVELEDSCKMEKLIKHSMEIVDYMFKKTIKTNKIKQSEYR